MHMHNAMPQSESAQMDDTCTTYSCSCPSHHFSRREVLLHSACTTVIGMNENLIDQCWIGK